MSGEVCEIVYDLQAPESLEQLRIGERRNAEVAGEGDRIATQTHHATTWGYSSGVVDVIYVSKSVFGLSNLREKKWCHTSKVARVSQFIQNEFLIGIFRACQGEKPLPPKMWCAHLHRCLCPVMLVPHDIYDVARTFYSKACGTAVRMFPTPSSARRNDKARRHGVSGILSAFRVAYCS